MKHLQLLIKPVSSDCNLRCRYCFYLDESSNRSYPSYGIMSDATTRILIEKALSAAEESCTFGFQGGEPMLAGLPYFENFTTLVEEILQSNHKKHKAPQIRYVLQTNGTLINEQWIAFLKKHRVLTGISMDGTRSIHDTNRRDSSGQGSFAKVMSNARQLLYNGIDLNVLCVLTAQSASNIEAVYHFFKKEGFLFHQYIPCLDPLGEKRGQKEWSLSPALYADVLKKLFDLWFYDLTHGFQVSIREFENWIFTLRGIQPEACAWTGRCSMQNVIEADGGVYPCDFYVLDEYRIAGVQEDDFSFINPCNKHRFFIEHGDRGNSCPACKWYPLCRGGCARDYVLEEEGRHNYFCEAYRTFFPYAIARLEWLAARVIL